MNIPSGISSFFQTCEKMEKVGELAVALMIDLTNTEGPWLAMVGHYFILLYGHAKATHTQ